MSKEPSVLDQWEADARGPHGDQIVQTILKIHDQRILALIDLVRKKDALVQSTLSLLEECGMPSNAQEHEWLTEAIALTDKLDHTP